MIFIRKYDLLIIIDFNIRILNAYWQYKFTAQRVTEVSYFEVTTSRSSAVINGFHNVEFRPGSKPISYSVFR